MNHLRILIQSLKTYFTYLLINHIFHASRHGCATNQKHILFRSQNKKYFTQEREEPQLFKIHHNLCER